MSDDIKTVPGVMVGGMRIMRTLALKEKLDNLTFDTAIDSTATREDLFIVLDNLSAAVEREHWKVDLAELEKAHKTQRENYTLIGAQIRGLEDEKNRQQMAWRSDWDRRKRSDFQLNDHQKAAIAEFDGRIKAAQLNAKNFLRDRPITEWQIACLKAKIAGEEEPRQPPEVAKALAERIAELSILTEVAA